MAGDLMQAVGAVLGELRQKHGASNLARVEGLVAGIAGKRAAPAHPLQPELEMIFPGLAAKPWYDASAFPQAARLAAAAGQLRAEFVRGLLDGADPASADPARVGAALRALDGKAPNLLAESRERYAPLTAVLRGVFRAELHEPVQVKVVPLPRGERNRARACADNFYLSFRVGLLGRGRLRVAGEERAWEAGGCLVNDDSFEHDSIHEGQEDFGLMLIARAWHPELTPPEIEALLRLGAVMTAASGPSAAQWRDQLSQLQRP